MVGIVETIRDTVLIFGCNKANVDVAEAEVSTPKPRDDKTTDPDKASFTRSAIIAAHTIQAPQMTQVQ